VLAVAGFAVGCADTLGEWRVADPVELTQVATLPGRMEVPTFAAAPRRRRKKEARKRGGAAASVNILPFTGFDTRATLDPEHVALGYNIGVGGDDVNVQYSDIFSNGFGFAGSWIISAPTTGAPAFGDTFVMLTGEWLTFTGNDGLPSGHTPGTLTLLGIWSDAKTMLNKAGSRVFLKPYVQYGIGLVSSSAVNIGGYPFYDAGFCFGLRASLGVDFKLLGIKFFLDGGAQVISPPNDGGDGGLGDAEPMFVMPIRLGLTMTF
jgi:hypothetical protein